MYSLRSSPLKLDSSTGSSDARAAGDATSFAAAIAALRAARLRSIASSRSSPSEVLTV